METNHLDVDNKNSDLDKKSPNSYEFAMDRNQYQGKSKRPSVDQSTFSEGSAQATTVDRIDDEQIQHFGYDLEVKIPKTVLDEIFYSYFLKQRSFGLIWFLISSIHFDAYCVWLQYTNNWAVFGSAIFLLSLNLSIIAVLLYSRYKKNKYLQTIWKISPYIAWLISVAQIGTFHFLDSKNQDQDQLEILSWCIFINFQIYITLPIPLLWEGVALGLLNGVFFTLLTLVKCHYENQCIVTNMTMGVTAAVIGIVHSILNELKQRIAFLEAKKSLEVNMKIEEHSQVQERLLLSVLPKYVADKVRMDMGVTKSDQFKKIYMSRHENVSILYADIVGFTAISSTYSAQDLVKMLNELFARFDRLADKYEQLRIKILGDCYYCISGAPDEKIDHAILSCHMGLSMVHAIKYLQHKTNSPVDMRVGIHTGAILAGILGQRQWQFDVYSKDVELANKMESSGMAGRVHISETTRLCLGDQFAVEPAYGEKREPALRLAGLTTYFITKVLVPFEERNKHELQEHSTINIQSEHEEGFKDMIDEDSLSSMDNIEDNFDPSAKLPEFIERFKTELNELTQDELHFRQLSEKTNMFLTFVNKGVEKAYHKNREKISSLTLLPIAIINIVDSVCSLYIFNSSKGLILKTGPSMLIMAVTIIFMAESCGVLSSCLRSMSKRVNDNEWLRHGIALTVILITIITFLKEMYSYYGEIISNGSQNDGIEILSFQSFYTNLGILLLMSVAVISHLTHIVKIGIMVGYLCIYSTLLYVLIQAENGAALTAKQNIRAHAFNLNMIILLSAVTLVLCYLTRYMDRDDRVIFMWKTEVGEQRKKYADMRKKNQALVYNVLPVNVAEHFMKNIKRSHLYLYSQSYSEVGVLFASMPNFSDFYSEETVNNQGLECLRVLNEVISDYDALLDLPRFKEITKIKTIGSTYMAASGLNILKEFDSSEPVIIRWSHLDILVQFAFELTQALQDINEQSFNNFVLKMGVNHGPITAGVIGASKPHYDIWGNTVNVASRMESTGQAGAIQVTKETAQILSFFGYAFKQRGYVNVKGKGELLTFYLQGKESPPDHTTITPTTSSPINTTPKNISKTVHNKSIKNISLLDIIPSAELKQNGSPINSNTKKDLTINEIDNSQLNLNQANNVSYSPSFFSTENCDDMLKNEYEANDSENNKNEMSITKEEDHKSTEIEIDVRTPLLGSNNASGSEK